MSKDFLKHRLGYIFTIWHEVTNLSCTQPNDQIFVSWPIFMGSIRAITKEFLLFGGEQLTNSSQRAEVA